MQSYGRTSKFFRLDGLLLFSIVMELRSASSASKVEGARKLKHHAVEIFNRAKFTLHKWHSNVPELEITVPMTSLPFSKQQLGASSVRGECKLLGLKRDKVDDTLHVSLPSQPVTLTGHPRQLSEDAPFGQGL